MVDRRNLAVGAMYLAIAVAAGVAAWGYRLGSLQRMGPGYFPMLIACGLGLVGLIIMARAVTAGGAGKPFDVDLRPVAWVTLGTVLFGLLLRPGGLLAAIAALILIASLGNSRRNWLTAGLSVAILAPACWLIFVYGLRLPLTFLPSGSGF